MYVRFTLKEKNTNSKLGNFFNRSLEFQTNLLILGEKLLLNKISISVGHGRNIIDGQQSKSIHNFGYFSALYVNFKNTKKKKRTHIIEQRQSDKEI